MVTQRFLNPTPGQVRAENLARVFYIKPKAKILREKGYNTSNMENIEFRPFENDEWSKPIIAKSSTLILLVEKVSRVGSISIGDAEVKLTPDVHLHDIANIQIETIPGETYHLSVRKSDYYLKSRAISEAEFTVVHR